MILAALLSLFFTVSSWAAFGASSSQGIPPAPEATGNSPSTQPTASPLTEDNPSSTQPATRPSTRPTVKSTTRPTTMPGTQSDPKLGELEDKKPGATLPEALRPTISGVNRAPSPSTLDLDLVPLGDGRYRAKYVDPDGPFAGKVKEGTIFNSLNDVPEPKSH